MPTFRPVPQGRRYGGLLGGIVLGLRVTRVQGWAASLRVLRNHVWFERYSQPPLFIQNKQMINYLISNYAGRHTTHVPAGGAAERFILFNNKSKTNVAFYPLSACMGPLAQRAGQWHLARTRIPSTRKEGAGAGLPSWHFRTGVKVGAGVRWCWNGSKERGNKIAQKGNTIYSGTTCGHSLPEKEKRTRNQEAPILAMVLTLPRYVISWANSALVSTPVK